MRVSIVNDTYIGSISQSSIFQVGDNQVIAASSRALAVQREKAIFNINEGAFSQYSLFSQPIHQPFIYEDVTMNINNPIPYLYVNKVKITAMAASAVVQIGSNHAITTESRIKHIRQLLKA